MTNAPRPRLRSARWWGLCALVVLLGACGEAHVVRREPDESVSRRPSAPPARVHGSGEVEVARGDTLYAIAFRHGMDFRDLAAINAIAPPYTIYVGQVLKLHGERARPAAPATVAATASPPVTRAPVRPRPRPAANDAATATQPAPAARPPSPKPPVQPPPADRSLPTPFETVPSTAEAGSPASGAAAHASSSTAPSVAAHPKPPPELRDDEPSVADPNPPRAPAQAVPRPATAARRPPPSQQDSEPSIADPNPPVLPHPPVQGPPRPLTIARRAPPPAPVPAEPEPPVPEPTQPPPRVPLPVVRTPSAPVLPAVLAPVGGIAWHWPAKGALVERFAAGDATRQGIDIAGHAGDAVLATADGVVVYSGSGLVGYGELIIVKHSDEWLSAYGHNRRRLVGEGQRVKAGQPIAEMGNSGAPRDELHFEIRRNGRPVDPLQYLPGR